MSNVQSLPSRNGITSGGSGGDRIRSVQDNKDATEADTLDTSEPATTPHAHVAAINIARVYAGLGEMDEAFAWLDEACDERNGELMFLKLETPLGTGEIFGRNILNDSRLEDLLDRIGL